MVDLLAMVIALVQQDGQGRHAQDVQRIITPLSRRVRTRIFLRNLKESAPSLAQLSAIPVLATVMVLVIALEKDALATLAGAVSSAIIARLAGTQLEHARRFARTTQLVLIMDAVTCRASVSVKTVGLRRARLPDFGIMAYHSPKI